MFDVCVCAKGSFLEPLKTDDTDRDPGEGVDFPAPFLLKPMVTTQDPTWLKNPPPIDGLE